MCDALRELMKADLAQAEIKGMHKSNLKALAHVMNSFSVDAEKAMDVLDIPAGERGFYRSQLPRLH